MILTLTDIHHRQLLLSQLPDLMSILSLLEQSISVLLKWQEKDEVDVSNIGVEHKRRRVSRGSTAKAGQAKALACDAINAVKQCHRAIVKILGDWLYYCCRRLFVFVRIYAVGIA